MMQSEFQAYNCIENIYTIVLICDTLDGLIRLLYLVVFKIDLIK